MSHPAGPGRSAARQASMAGERQAYAGLFALRGVTLPLRPSSDRLETGVVEDATGRDVFVVDVNGARDEGDVAAIAALIAEAVNARGGHL